ncbi:MAG: alpha/beta hydrolase [Anaerolineae bacterium]|nr:alpha/beta hydrolase [Anaerolineae bacterium]
MNSLYSQHSAPARVQANGIELVYDTFGDPEAIPLLLIAGLGDQMLAWHEGFCSQLAARGYWVIRFDNRDAGLSTKFDHAGTPAFFKLIWAFVRKKSVAVPYTLHDMALDAVGLLDALNISAAHIVGGSLGGLIAQSLAYRHPQRVRTLTLLISSTMNPRLLPPHPKSLVLFKSPSPGLEGYVEHTVKARRAVRGSRFPFDEAALRTQAKLLYERNPDIRGAARQTAALFANRYDEQAIKSIAVPTLVIHGSADPLIPVRHAYYTAKILPDATLLIIEGMGHEFPPEVWPQVIDALVQHTTQESS